MKHYNNLKLLVFCLILVSAFSSRGQSDCQKCDSRLVYLFDMAVHARNPYALEPSKDCDAQCMEARQREIDHWKSLHFASPAYKEALMGYGPEGEGCIMFNQRGNQGFPWLSPDLYIASKSSNWLVTQIINSGDENLQPTYSALPPQPDLTDYLMYGILKYDTAGHQYMARIITLNFRKNEVIWETEYGTQRDGGDMSAAEAARMAITSGRQNFKKDILPGYEKRKRDESNTQSNGIVALKARLKFPVDAFEMEYEKYTANEQNIEFTLIDCDDTPLKNKKVKFTVTEGSLEQNEVTTDENGRGKVVFKAPDHNCTADLEGNWAFEYPSGKPDITTARAAIQVRKPAEWLKAKVTVKVVSKMVAPSFSDSDPTQAIDGETSFTTDMLLQIVRGRVERYLKDPKKRTECGKGSHCAVLTGSSYEMVRDPENPLELIKNDRYPINVSRKSSEKGKRLVGNDTQFVVVHKTDAGGVNKVEAISLEINTYYGSDDIAVPTALIPKYIVTISGGRYGDRLNPQKYPCHGDGTSLSWDDFKQKLVDNGNALEIGIPYGYGVDEPVQTESELTIPLLIDDAKGLDQWLLNPMGSKTLTLKGKHYYKDGYSESEQNVFVTLNLTPRYD
jgi:hypothetical protein